VSLGAQVVWLLVLPLAVSSVAWTITQEEIFREPRDYALRQSEQAPQRRREGGHVHAAARGMEQAGRSRILAGDGVAVRGEVGAGIGVVGRREREAGQGGHACDEPIRQPRRTVVCGRGRATAVRAWWREALNQDARAAR
jgi:hypothetical protein